MSNTGQLKNSLTEIIFILTVQPKTYKQICSLYSSLGTAASMDDTLKQLGYNSFMEMVRKRAFPFLSTFVAKNYDGKDDAMPYTLYFWNTDATNHPKFRADLFQQEQINMKLFPLAVNDTVYFEVHNSLTFLEGRKEFVRLIAYCEQEDLKDINGMVPLSKLTSAFSTLYPNEVFSTKLKTWFPNSGGIEKIVQKILFEDVDFALSDASKKRECVFCLYDDCNLEMTLAKINDIKIGIEAMKENVEREIHADTMANLPEINRLTRRQSTINPPSEAKRLCSASQTPLQKRIPVFGVSAEKDSGAFSIEKNIRVFGVPRNAGIFGDSEDEEEYRAENAEYHQRTSRRPSISSLCSEVHPNPPEVSNVLEGIESLVKKYKICEDDINLEELLKDSVGESEYLANCRVEHVEDLDDDYVSQALNNVSPMHLHNVNEKRGHYEDSDDELPAVSFAPTGPNVSSTEAKIDHCAPKVEEFGNIAGQESEKSATSMRSLFYRPSPDDLKNCCEKLGLKYDGEADEFWRRINIVQLPFANVPDEIYSPSNNGFASVSLFFTGTEDNATTVKEALNKYFYANIKEIVEELGFDFATFDYEGSATTLFSESMTAVHIYSLGRLIGCTIGIYDGNCWNDYGTWKENSGNALTLLMSFKNDLYSPVLSLKEL